jgi:hypothetical protein
MKSVFSTLSDFWSILYCLNRRAELLRLVRWAEYKSVSGPLNFYENRLEDEEIRLNSYTVRNPQLVKWVRRFHQFNDLILPPPRYPRPGVAAGYRVIT